MALNAKVKELLDNKNVAYEVITHPTVYSSIEEARTLGIDADEVAKVLVVTLHGQNSLVVVPGAHKLDSKKLRHFFGHRHARLATEEELSRDFKEFELGAVPPFGELFHIPVYIDQRLLEHKTVVFTGGTHTDSIKMSVEDLMNTTKAKVVDLTTELAV